MVSKILVKKIEIYLKMIQFGNRFIQKNLSVSLSKAEQYNKKIYVVALYYTILDLAENIITLLKCKKPISIPIIVRSMHEAMVDMQLIIDKDDYFQLRLKEFIEYKIKIMKHADDNVVEKYSTRNDYLQLMDELFEDVGKMKQIKSKRIRLNYKYRLAELNNYLNEAYPYLCSHAHNDFLALELRHIRIKSGKKIIRRTFTLGNEAWFPIIMPYLGCLFYSVVKVHTFIKTDYWKNNNLTRVKKTYEACAKLLHKKYSH